MLSDPGIGTENPLTDCTGDAGSASNTTGGTVKVPSLVRAVHVNAAVAALTAEARVELAPVICTYPAGSPPLQLSVTPFARLTVVVASWLVHTSGGGTFNPMVNGPTSGPLGPVMVYCPAVR